MKETLEHGGDFMQAVMQSELFAPLVVQMLSVGDKSAAIDDMLIQVAQHYEREVDYDLRRLTDLIEPLLLVILGGMVLLLAFGIFLPMWNMVGLVR